MEILKGDFIGFTYNGVHSSELGIVRTSDGSRFNENLLPTFTDKTAVASGVNETYYFGTQFTQKPTSVPVAFDSLTEEQFRKLRQIFGDQKIHDLIFDELPFKVYSAKVSSAPSWQYICFEDEQGNRVYKGEGTIQFIYYNPFARSRYKFLDQYTEDNIPEWKTIIVEEPTDTKVPPDIYKVLNDETSFNNKDEWKDASGMLESQTINGRTYDQYAQTSSTSGTSYSDIHLYNPGDIETNFILRFPKELINKPIRISLRRGSDGVGELIENSELIIDTGSETITDDYLQINTKLQLIEGLDKRGGDSGYQEVQITEEEFNAGKADYWYVTASGFEQCTSASIYSDTQIYYTKITTKIQYILTGNIYNQYIAGGEFFKIPTNIDNLGYDLVILGYNGNDDWTQLSNPSEVTIQYDYLYF